MYTVTALVRVTKYICNIPQTVRKLIIVHVFWRTEYPLLCLSSPENQEAGMKEP